MGWWDYSGKQNLTEEQKSVLIEIALNNPEVKESLKDKEIGEVVIGMSYPEERVNGTMVIRAIPLVRITYKDKNGTWDASGHMTN